jgi:hypothetical protein
MKHTLLAVFECEADVVNAAKMARSHGWRVVEIYAPYPLHASAELLDLKRSRLSWVALVGGLAGVALAFAFQYWTSARDWPLNIGGRPWNSLPAFVPVAFEMMVLCAGLGLVAALLIACRLYPGKAARDPGGRATDDQFVLEVQASTANTDSEPLRRLFRDCHACGVEEMRGL